MADEATFSLESRSLKLDTAADIEPHIAALTKPEAVQITHLNLSGNTIGVEAAEALAPHLSALSTLRVANLADIFTGRLLSEIPKALDALLQALLHCKELHTVNLSDNAFGLNTQAPLVKFLEKHTPLRHLILNNNGLGPEAGTLVANALKKLAEEKKKAAADGKDAQLLETIVCGRNRLENGSAPAWADALAAHASSLNEVRMSQDGIHTEGIQIILRSGLRGARQLQALDLQDNFFTAPGARALVEVIGGWGELVELQISDTLLSARGAVLLGEALAKGGNKKLQTLKLQFDEIDAKGVQAIVNAIKKEGIPELRRVELNGNKFAEEDPAVDELRDVLQERKEQAGVEGDDEAWGLDELDELEDESDEDEDEDEDETAGDEEDDEVQEKAEKQVKQADVAENEPVSLKDDKDVDALADKLDKTEI